MGLGGKGREVIRRGYQEARAIFTNRGPIMVRDR